MTKVSDHIATLRNEYLLAELNEDLCGDDPLLLFAQWFEEAEKAKIHEPNAMSLATVDKENKPHVRIVLLKGIDERGYVFYSNYQSDKGRQLVHNQAASLLFFWKELERQVRIEGKVEKVSSKESDEYFKSRPLGSRISASASPQSQVIANRLELENRVKELTLKYPEGDIPRPENWGGYRVIPYKIEFWQGRANRLHDRIVYSLQKEGLWKKHRIAP